MSISIASAILVRANIWIDFPVSFLIHCVRVTIHDKKSMLASLDDGTDFIKFNPIYFTLIFSTALRSDRL